MPVTATFEIAQTKLLYQQSTVCKVKLSNRDKTTLSDINPLNAGAYPTWVVTDVATGEVKTYSQPHTPGKAVSPVDLPPGTSLEFEFGLYQFAKFPHPGLYDVQTRWEWNHGAGRATSAAVRIELQSSRPCLARTVDSTGGGSATSYCAWINAVEPSKGKFALWLAELSGLGDEWVAQQAFVHDLDAIVEPCLSLPPRSIVPAQWIAWTRASGFTCVIHADGVVLQARTHKLPVAEFRIVAPLLANAVAPKEPRGSADALLYSSNEDGKSSLLVLHLAPNCAPRAETPVVVPGAAPLWAKTAYPSARVRYTFMLVPEPNSLALRLFSWSPAAPPSAFMELTRWGESFLAAEVGLLSDGNVCGVFFGRGGNQDCPTYEIHTWRLMPGQEFRAGERVAIQWSDAGRIDQCILRLDADGLPHALCRNGGNEPSWWHIAPDGRVSALPSAARNMQVPLDLLFRGGVYPVMMYTEADCGFRFAQLD